MIVIVTHHYQLFPSSLHQVEFRVGLRGEKKTEQSIPKLWDSIRFMCIKYKTSIQYI